MTFSWWIFNKKSKDNSKKEIIKKEIIKKEIIYSEDYKNGYRNLWIKSIANMVL